MALTKSVDEIVADDSTGLLGKHSQWERVRLREIATVLNGYPFDSAHFDNVFGTPLIRIRDVVDGSSNTFFNAAFDTRYLIAPGDLLVGMDGDFNCAYWRSGTALLNQRVCKISVRGCVYEPRLLQHVLPVYLSAINAETSSVTVKHLSSKTVEDICLPLPPFAEQRRLADRLDEILSDFDAGVSELRAAKHKLGLYRRSLLKAAFGGDLTAVWRKRNPSHETGAELLERILRERRGRWDARREQQRDQQGSRTSNRTAYPEPQPMADSVLPPVPTEWAWASLDMLGEIVSGVAKGGKPKAGEVVHEVSYLRVANVQRGRLDLAEVKTIKATERDIAELTLRPGDVLFNEGGDRDKLGRGWVWEGQLACCIHQNHVFRMRPVSSDVASEFVSHHGNTFGQRWFESAGKQTTNLASINLGVLRSFPVPVPPSEEQRQIVTVVREQLEALDRQEIAIDRALHLATAQRQNILRAAFSGQLVPQDPADEPASVLLDRIRAERALSAVGPSPNGRSRTRRQRSPA